METTLNHRHFSVEFLSRQGLAMLSELALRLHHKYGISLDLDSDDVVMQALINSRGIKDRRLKSICLHMKTEICMNYAEQATAAS